MFKSIKFSTLRILVFRFVAPLLAMLKYYMYTPLARRGRASRKLQTARVYLCYTLKSCLRGIYLFLATLFIYVAPGYAMLDLELTQGVNSAVPIAILTFTGQESISSNDNNVSDVVGKDLQNSGRFRLFDASTLLPDFQNKDTVNYDYWHEQKVNDVVSGQIQNIGGDKFKVSFKLNDIYSKSILLERDYTVSSSQLRALAHHISDLVYKQLTGDHGIFSTKIAYILVQRTAGASAHYSFEVSDYDGYNPRTLLVSDQPLMSPSWSPDGRQIAYVSFEGNRAAIYVQDVATGARRILTNYPGINGAPAWSPDGSKIALVLSETGYPKIYVMSVGSNQPQQITSDWYLDTEPSWAPDGRSLIFTSNRGGSPQIYRVNLGSKSVQRVTYKGNYNARSSFAPDGKSIAMLHQNGAGFGIGVQDLESGRVTIISNSGNDESPSMAPNGKMVVFATDAGGRSVLGMASSDGKVKLTLPARAGSVQEPAWSPFLDKTKN